MPIRPQKAFSQNFLENTEYQQKVCACLRVDQTQAVVEIGPGTGALTQHLVRKNDRKLLLVEYDKRCVELLTETFLHHPNVHLFHEDVLKFDWHTCPAPFSIIGSLPYHITSPILLMLKTIPSWQEAVFIIQKEVGERITAAPNSRAYGRLSVLLQLIAHVDMVFEIPSNAFNPAPAVTSCVVRLTPHAHPPDPNDISMLEKLTNQCFQQRRKQIKNSLKTIPDIADTLQNMGIDEKARPESLSPQTLLKLAQNLRTFYS